MLDLRKIEVLKDLKWQEVQFYELREGDIFRMFESTGESVLNTDGQTIFYASTNPFGADGVWSIDIK